MRLDHLLSKELTTPLPASSGSRWCQVATRRPLVLVVVAHGWNIRLGMLLGPEDAGTGSLWWVGGVFLLVAAFCWPSRVAGWLGLVGGLLENCTVDASIFDLYQEILCDF